MQRADRSTGLNQDSQIRLRGKENRTSVVRHQECLFKAEDEISEDEMRTGRDVRTKCVLILALS